MNNNPSADPDGSEIVSEGEPATQIHLLQPGPPPILNNPSADPDGSEIVSEGEPATQIHLLRPGPPPILNNPSANPDGGEIVSEGKPATQIHLLQPGPPPILNNPSADPDGSEIVSEGEPATQIHLLQPGRQVQQMLEGGLHKEHERLYNRWHLNMVGINEVGPVVGWLVGYKVGSDSVKPVALSWLALGPRPTWRETKRCQ